nr:hypothetical protein [Pseudomonas corrugata]
MFGLLHAREGDHVSCGRDGKTYQIRGGIAHMVSHGKHLAGTLDSHSTCPCKAQLIPRCTGLPTENRTSHRKPVAPLNRLLNTPWTRRLHRGIRASPPQASCRSEHPPAWNLRNRASTSSLKA